MKTIRGLNLGGWLVLEKWMTPGLYEGYDAKDEYNLLKALGEKRFEILEKHRNTFITENDFKWIRDVGINTVRIPVGHWLFDGKYPYINAKSYVDKAFLWATKYDLDVVLDVHAAPGCQNGFDNGGLSGVCEWHKDQKYIDQTVDFIKQLCEVYQDQPRLSGIQVLNEPRWDIKAELLEDFYIKSYNVIRGILPLNVSVIFHDGFRLDIWESFFKNNDFVNVILDTHMYQVFSHNDSIRDMNQTILKAAEKRHKELQPVMKYVPVVVGEWSLGLHPNVLSQTKNEFVKEALYRAVGNSLLITFEQTAGWFFWNYKLSEEATKRSIGWSFKDVIDKGYLPPITKGEKQ
jgi:glucan 1,3-beta-glucosidase